MFHIHVLYLYIPWSSSLICHISKETRSLLLDNSIKSQMGVLGVLVATAAIVSRPSHLTERGNICVYTNTCIHTYL